LTNKILAIALSITESFWISEITNRTHGRSYSITVCTVDAVHWTL